MSTSKMNGSKIVNVAVIGLGRAGQIHLRNALQNEDIKVLYIIDRLDVAKESLLKCGVDLESGPRILDWSSADIALNDKALHGVVVCTPTNTHYEVIERCLKAKKPVFTEKPVACDLITIDKLFSLAQELNVPLFCGYNRRFDPGLANAQRAVTTGKVGLLKQIRQTARDSPCPQIDYLKTSGGFIPDSGSHEINLLRWMMQEDPYEVYAITYAHNQEIKDIGDVDQVTMVFKFTNGKVGTVDMDRCAVYGYDQRIEMYGDMGLIKVDNTPQTGLVFKSKEGHLEDNILESFPQRFHEAYQNEMKHFVEVMKGATPAITWADCRADHIISDAATLSANLGQAITIDYINQAHKPVSQTTTQTKGTSRQSIDSVQSHEVCTELSQQSDTAKTDQDMPTDDNSDSNDSSEDISKLSTNLNDCGLKDINQFGSDYRQYVGNDNIRPAVMLSYAKNHKYQTYEEVTRLQNDWLKLNKMKLGVWDALELLSEVVDESDPDIELPQIAHLLQTAEALRKAYPEHDWLHMTGLLHDIGKVMAHPKLGELPQWAVVGDTFPVGCKHDERVIYHEMFAANPDAKDPRYNTQFGVYSEGCGLSNVKMSWGHDEYAYHVLKESGCTLPEAGLFIVRYHSFYALHQHNAYDYLLDESDRQNLEWLKIFQKFDLYSKVDDEMDDPKLKEYYVSLINKYIPGGQLQF